MMAVHFRVLLTMSIVQVIGKVVRKQGSTHVEHRLIQRPINNFSTRAKSNKRQLLSELIPTKIFTSDKSFDNEYFNTVHN